MKTKTGKNISLLLALMAFLPCCIQGMPCSASDAVPLPVFPQASQAKPTPPEQRRAERISELVQRENPRLRRDGCLATQAFMRAKRMSMAGYFAHEDPRTGKNPVWKVVKICVQAKRPWTKAPAAENLAQGIDTPENIHSALMESPSHRKNILDPRFNHVGVGCYGEICVELFGGY